MSDTQKTIALTKQTAQITGEVLKTMLKDFLENKSVKKGNIGMSELVQRSGGKLESIEVTDNNIRSFLDVAKKYDIDFALKRDKSVEPPIYQVYFATNKTDNFKKAFTEYAYGVQNKSQQRTYTVSREAMNQNAKKISQQRDDKSQEKERTLQKNQNISGR